MTDTKTLEYARRVLIASGAFMRSFHHDDGRLMGEGVSHETDSRIQSTTAILAEFREAVLAEEKCPSCNQSNLGQLCFDCGRVFGGDQKNYEEPEIVTAIIPDGWNPFESLVIDA